MSLKVNTYYKNIVLTSYNNEPVEHSKGEGPILKQEAEIVAYTLIEFCDDLFEAFKQGFVFIPNDPRCVPSRSMSSYALTLVNPEFSADKQLGDKLESQVSASLEAAKTRVGRKTKT